eukprot:6952720-Prymnesium_polylepis.1
MLDQLQGGAYGDADPELLWGDEPESTPRERAARLDSPAASPTASPGALNLRAARAGGWRDEPRRHRERRESHPGREPLRRDHKGREWPLQFRKSHAPCRTSYTRARLRLCLYILHLHICLCLCLACRRLGSRVRLLQRGRPPLARRRGHRQSPDERAAALRGPRIPRGRRRRFVRPALPGRGHVVRTGFVQEPAAAADVRAQPRLRGRLGADGRARARRQGPLPGARVRLRFGGSQCARALGRARRGPHGPAR